jgi:hypothetical protein
MLAGHVESVVDTNKSAVVYEFVGCHLMADKLREGKVVGDFVDFTLKSVTNSL